MLAVSVLFDELRTFTKDLASMLEEKYGDIVKNWLGDGTSVRPLKTSVNEMILKDLLNI